MGDRCSVQITIGGRLPRSLVPELIQICQLEDLRVDWDGEPVTEPTETMYAQEVNYGCLDDLESFCVRNGLVYRLENDAGQGYGAGVKTWDGEAERHFLTGEINDTPALSTELLRSLGSYDEVLSWCDKADWQPPALEVMDD